MNGNPAIETPGAGDALLVVDVQYDFLPGGALGVRNGDQVVAPLNRMIARWRTLGLPLVFTRDWHPANHCSFHAQGGQWPPHCVATTPGAQFASSLAVPAEAIITSKGTDPHRDGDRGMAERVDREFP